MRLRITFVLATVASMQGGTIFDVVNLGSLGGPVAQGTGISQTGQVVGSASDPFHTLHAVTYQPGVLPQDVGFNTATAINTSGQISGVGYQNGSAYAVLWQGGTLQWMGGAGSYAMAINESGQLAGMLTDAGGHGHAFVSGSGGLEDLGTLAGGTWSSAYSLNNTGQAAGYGDVAGGRFRAFLWTPGQGFSTLGTLGGANSYAMAINDAGQVAGQAQVASGYLHAFLWSNGVMQDLGTLGGTSSYAYGLNALGDVVGWSGMADSQHAFLFQNGVMLDLNALIDPGSGWVLSQAFGINDAGQIVGAGYFQGQAAAFLLNQVTFGVRAAQREVFDQGLDAPQLDVDPPSPSPEPASLLLSLAGLGALAMYRVRSARS